MLKSLQQISGFFFYLLGAGFFLAAVLLRNGVGGVWPAYWLQVADLPLAFAAVLYAGISLYQSLRPAEGHSRLLAIIVAAPLGAFFILILVLNFWTA